MYDKKVLPDMTGARADASISLVRFDPAKELEILRVRQNNSSTDCTPQTYIFMYIKCVLVIV